LGLKGFVVVVVVEKREADFLSIFGHTHALGIWKTRQDRPCYIGGNICWGYYSAIFFHMIYL